MFVKICGITRLTDAEAAIAAGAGALGFVFWPDSPRFVDPYLARAIVAGLPPFVTAVGVFVNQPADYVSGVAALVRLGAVQLHGDESPAYSRQLARPVLKSVDSTASAAELSVWPDRVTLLLDVHDPVRRGGTGRTVDWDAAASIARRRRTILAGGLSPANIGEAVARVRPYGVDVSSGVETSPGIKDPARLTALFEALHEISNSPARS